MYKMGNVVAAVGKALSCSDLWRYVLNAARCDSQCGTCGCSCETDLVDPGSDSEYSVDIDSCCGTAHYLSAKKGDHVNGDWTAETGLRGEVPAVEE